MVGMFFFFSFHCSLLQLFAFHNWNLQVTRFVFASSVKRTNLKTFQSHRYLRTVLFSDYMCWALRGNYNSERARDKKERLFRVESSN